MAPITHNKHLRLGALVAGANLLLSGPCHYGFSLLLAAGNLVQDVSYLEIVTAVVAVPLLVVGFANGYIASRRGGGFFLALFVSLLSLPFGIVASGRLFDALRQSGTPLWNHVGRPIVANLGWYAFAIGVVGVAFGAIAFSVLTGLRDLMRRWIRGHAGVRSD